MSSFHEEEDDYTRGDITTSISHPTPCFIPTTTCGEHSDRPRPRYLPRLHSISAYGSPYDCKLQRCSHRPPLYPPPCSSNQHKESMSYAKEQNVLTLKLKLPLFGRLINGGGEPTKELPLPSLSDSARHCTSELKPSCLANREPRFRPSTATIRSLI